jgi:hypothetical protein
MSLYAELGKGGREKFPIPIDSLICKKDNQFLQLSELSTVDHEVFFANCVVGKSLYYS